LKIAVVRFPGSNCDQDALWALRSDVGVAAEYVWHEATSLSGFDGVFLPGGFSYGDYLRCGAMAARAPLMSAVRDLAERGHPVIGACNGFQVLCEAGLLEGALLLNHSQKFVCRDVRLRPETQKGLWMESQSQVLRLPIAHGEGRYIADRENLSRLNGEGRVAFRYVDSAGDATEDANPNGSVENIAGIVNEAGNVLGLMPHPERATNARIGGTDGLVLLRAFSAMKV